MDRNQEDDSDTSSLDSIPQSAQPRPHQQYPYTPGEKFNNLFHRGQTPDQHSNIHSNRPHLPKMTFPVFTGKVPRIRRDKCEDYFLPLKHPFTAQSVAKLVLHNMVKYMGVPSLL